MSNRFLTGVENDSKTSVSSRPISVWMAAGNLDMADSKTDMKVLSKGLS